jgi:hypothetical protein
MRRLVYVALSVLVLGAVFLPTQRDFTAKADADGERLAMFCKPAVVRIVDGAVGTIVFQPPGYQRVRQRLRACTRFRFLY